jgi:hypothetical protein
MATRRTFLQLATAWWSAAALQAQQQPATFLNPTELETLRRLTNILIPADERSGGANAAKVELYIDGVLAHANPALQKTWRAGIKRFEKADEPKLQKIAANELTPRTQDERFFVLLKDATVEGFYTSQEGILKELGYRGYSHLREFPAADMSLVKVPPGYHARLRERS